MLCFKPAKRVFDFTLTEGSDDLDNRVNMSKSSRGYFEDCKFFDYVPYLQWYAILFKWGIVGTLCVFEVN